MRQAHWWLQMTDCVRIAVSTQAELRVADPSGLACFRDVLRHCREEGLAT